jgi:hypothetical protein
MRNRNRTHHHNKNLYKFLLAFYRDDRGQSITEYMLILSAAVVGAGVLARAIMDVLDKGILKLGGQLEKDLKTGRAPLGVWRN